MKTKQNFKKYRVYTEVLSFNHYRQEKVGKYYIFRVCVYSLSYPACKAHALYFIVLRYHIFPHYLTNCTNFEKKKY
jgi:hypothetical protein